MQVQGREPSPERVVCIEDGALVWERADGTRHVGHLFVRIGVAWLPSGACAVTQVHGVWGGVDAGEACQMRALGLPVRTQGWAEDACAPGVGRWDGPGDATFRLCLVATTMREQAGARLDLQVRVPGGPDAEVWHVQGTVCLADGTAVEILPVAWQVRRDPGIVLHWADRSRWDVRRTVPVWEVDVSLYAASRAGHAFGARQIRILRAEYCRSPFVDLVPAHSRLREVGVDTRTTSDISVGYGLSFVDNGPILPGAPWVEGAAVTGVLAPAQGQPPLELQPGHHLVLLGVATDDAGQVVHGLHVVTLPPWPTTHHA